MTSARRTNLYRITAVDNIVNPVLSVGLTDLAGSISEAYAEIRGDFRLVGNGTFKPSFGEGISPKEALFNQRNLLVIFLHGSQN